MNKVLLPIDLAHDEATNRILEQAESLSQRAEATFILLHVMDRIPALVEAQVPADLLRKHEESACEAILERARMYGLDQRSSVIVRRGEAHREIVQTAIDEGVDLIVIASHQPSAVDIVIGSTAASVVRNAHCSIMVLR